ncbi:hypothetical protein [Bradyrhizobium sp. CSS354]|uniref:hypothetical protein n=1 Tax=Bradyrhizobium sp. CSS354 TaxID=2699172 RepID=UPI0023B0BAD7|nr:hypothetical protein [Bradyrhizobium sp. CSS354]MDE5461157.1 hypothetical protein [Bradyrhizobium sp. CSS354]
MDDPNSIMISNLSAWGHVAELQTGTVELALLKLAARQPIPDLPLDDAEQRSDVLLVQLLVERDHFRRALALVEQLLGTDQPG